MPVILAHYVWTAWDSTGPADVGVCPGHLQCTCWQSPQLQFKQVNYGMCSLIAHRCSSDYCQVNGVHVCHCMVPPA